jgi:hypothetical protein
LEKLIPCILFAYREVPSETTGFSHFELLCERHIKRPLAILKWEWEEPIENEHSVLSSYILDTGSKLNSMTD